MTTRDLNVLNSILNPSIPRSDIPTEKPIEKPTEELVYASLPNYGDSRQLEVEGVKLAEAGAEYFTHALEKFNKSIELCPKNPSAFNNRAQLHRLCNQIPDALSDLNKALELSGGKGTVATRAYIQRAMIHRLKGDDELAKQDFTLAADLGSSFAKQQLVALNPYAALCSNMMAELMTKFHVFEE